MTEQAFAADEQLFLEYGSGVWRLAGPDGKPVFEAHPRTIYYHPAFGRWRDLPPGDRISLDGVESVRVRWDGGWAIGLTLHPNKLWRRLVRWEDSRLLARVDEAARALSDLTGLPFRSDEDPEPVMRVGFDPPSGGISAPADGSLDAAEYATGPAKEPPPARPPAMPVVTPAPAPQVYTVDDATDVRLPLRMGGGALLDRDDRDRLLLVVPTGTSTSTLGLTLLGLVALAVFAGVIWILRSGSLGSNPLFGLALAGGVLVAVGVLGVLVLSQINRRLERRVLFDRKAGQITIRPGEADDQDDIPLSDLHGIRLRGEAIRKRSKLAYQRTISLILDAGDLAIFTEIRDTALPPDPAVMPSLAALRRQADEQAGPSLARAGARVMAWYLRLPLADE